MKFTINNLHEFDVISEAAARSLLLGWPTLPVRGVLHLNEGGVKFLTIFTEEQEQEFQKKYFSKNQEL